MNRVRAVTNRPPQVKTQLAYPHLAHTQLAQSAVQIFAANDRINQILIKNLDPAAWRAQPPGNIRPIAAIFTHMHNVRTKWIRLTAPHLKLPSQLKRARCTPQQARAGLAQSAARCTEMLAEALGNNGRVKKFRRDGWAQPWPVGPEMLCYMLAHEAHHRGQVCMLAHQLGFRLPINVMSGLWNWEKLWKESGLSGGPGGRS
ncbi:MAG: DinB family protein [Terriglobales bacterium]